MRVAFYKVWSDLWGHKLRTLQVVMIIAIGVFSVGVVIGGRNLSAAAVNNDWRQSNPPTMKISVTPTMSADELGGLEHIDGVLAVEGFQSAPIQWRHRAEEPWQPATLNARADYADQKMSHWELTAGTWPERDDVAIERGYGQLHGLAVGDSIEVRIDGRARAVRIVGELNSRETAPMFSPDLVLYMAQERFEQVTATSGYGVVQARLAALAPDGSFDQVRADAIDAEVQSRLDKLGIESQGLIPVIPDFKRVASPQVHFAEGLMNSSFMLLGVVGAVVILLGGLLIYNTVSAVIAQQINQIGVMKAIGARRHQVFAIYAALIVSYGLLACLVAIPLSLLAANGLKLFFVQQLDAADPGFEVNMPAVGLQVIVALLSPLAASVVPLTKGSNITVREAISTFGLGGAAGLLDAMLARFKHVSYTVLLVIGSTFRHRARVTITQVALVTGGMVFIAVMGVQDSATYTFGPALTAIHRYDVNLTLQEDARTSKVVDLVRRQPHVTAVEMWNTTNAFVRPAAQRSHSTTDASASVFGIPLGSDMYSPQMVAGRWLELGDSRAVTLHQKLAAKVGAGVGDWLTLRFPNGRELNWQVVGVFFDPASDHGIYMPQDVYTRELKRGSKANTLFIKLADGAAAVGFAQSMTKVLEDKNFAVMPNNLFSASTVTEIVERRMSSFAVFIGLLTVMALLVAIVGGIGLGSTLSLSVLERTREIGVMRAIGASSRRISLMFVGEGLIQSVMSWLIAVPLGIPAAYFMATVVLSQTFGDALLYHFSPTGIVLWLVIVVVLGSVASWLPARSATRISVRESLVYQ